MTKVVLLVSAVFGLTGGLIFLARGNGFGVLIAAIVLLFFSSILMFAIASTAKWTMSDETERMLARLGGMSPEQLKAHREKQARNGKYGCAACCLMAGIILFLFSIVVDRL